MEPNIAAQLLLAASLHLLVYLLFGRFVEPRWKALPAGAFYLLITWIMATGLGWWGMVWVIGFPALGIAAHAALCRRHGIDWVRCEPREEYLRLRPWSRAD